MSETRGISYPKNNGHFPGAVGELNIWEAEEINYNDDFAMDAYFSSVCREGIDAKTFGWAFSIMVNVTLKGKEVARYSLTGDCDTLRLNPRLLDYELYYQATTVCVFFGMGMANGNELQKRVSRMGREIFPSFEQFHETLKQCVKDGYLGSSV